MPDLTDYDNVSKWKKWYDELPKINKFLVVISIAVVSLLIYWRSTKVEELTTCESEVRNLRDEIRNLKNLYAPITARAAQFYPDLELTQAVAQLSRDFEKMREYVYSKNYRNLSEEILATTISNIGELRHSVKGDIRLGVFSLVGNDNRMKFSNELTYVLKKGGLEARTAFGHFSVVDPNCLIWIAYVGDDRTIANRLKRALIDIIHNDICIMPMSDANSHGEAIRIFVMGEPTFDTDGRVTFQ